MRNVDWSDIKTFIQDKDAEFQFLELPNDYIIIARDSWFELKCYMTKESPRHPDQVEFEDVFKPLVGKLNKPVKQSSFTSKEENGKKLFTRTKGIKQTLSTGSNVISFSIPYNEVKFNALEIIGCEVGDTISLSILDTPTGAISTIPNYKLNQFGFDVNLPNGYYVRESKYDADLIKDMVVSIEYESFSGKEVGINFILHELK